MALAAVQPVSGKLTDIFGRRPGILICIAFFGLGNTICGVARSRDVMILGRVIAGIGGGGINSITSFISSDLIPLRQRGMWHGVGIITFNLGLGLGGIVGGAVNETWGWRWAFLGVIPLTILSAIGVYVFLPDYVPDGERQSIRESLERIDVGGSVTLVSALVTFLYGLNYESEDGLPSRLVIQITMPIAASLMVAFVIIETRIAREPILPVRLLSIRTVAAASLAGGFVSMAMFTIMFYAPLYFQLLGYGTRETGLLMLPQSIGGAIGSFLAGLTMRITGRYSVLKFLVLGLYVAGASGISTVNAESPIIVPTLYLCMEGFGFGGMLTVMFLALLSAVDHKDQAVATAILYVFRTTGATLGVALSSAVFRKVLSVGLDRSRTLSVPGEDQPLPINFQSLDSTLRECSRHHSRATPSVFCPPEAAQAYMSALHATFLLALGFAVAGFVSGALTKNNHLSKTRRASARAANQGRRS